MSQGYDRVELELNAQDGTGIGGVEKHGF